MLQEFEPKLPRDILKMLRNKTFDVRAKFGAIYSASKTEKYLKEKHDRQSASVFRISKH